MALPVNVSGLRRNIKNIAHNYTDAQVKVREATSNDPWGPSSTIMSEIADLTYNVVAFSEIMQMVWKRLNDHGKNWRHVYKALVLLEYLIKTGSEKVAEQSRENIHSISTLKDFQYIEEGKDQGINVREKAKAMVALLKDDERLRNERVRALKAKERFAQSVSGIAGDPDINSPTSPTYPGTFVTSASRAERDAYGIRGLGSPLSPPSAARDPWGLSPPAVDTGDYASIMYGTKENVYEGIPGEGKIDFATRSLPSIPTENITSSYNNSALQQYANQEPIYAAILKKPQANQADSSVRSKIQVGDPVYSNTSGYDAVDAWLEQDAKIGSSSNAETNKPASIIAMYENIEQPEAHYENNEEALRTLQPVDPWGVPAPKLQTISPPPLSPPKVDRVLYGQGASDPWGPVIPPVDPWGVVRSPTPPPDPFAPLPPQPSHADDFSLLTNRDKPATGTTPAGTSPPTRRSPAGFLGENSGLVNLDNLVASKPVNPIANSSALSTSFPNLSFTGVANSTLAPTPNVLFSSTNAINVNTNNNPFTALSTGTNASFNALSTGTNTSFNALSTCTTTPLTTIPTSTSTPYFKTDNSNIMDAFNTNVNNNDILATASPIPPLSQDFFSGANPFSGSVMGGGAVGVVPNPFQAAQSPKPSINELRASAVGGFNDPWGAPPHNNGFAALSTKGNDPF
ncbi:epsin-2 [Hyalella azteca]|uniref:Epsin-2 n=1 Tax=Hyalella azteca TaxID=294128 RepID=A0A8B7NPU9_HYAAZ|nr:epsin-2 [Hyalella azteca]